MTASDSVGPGEPFNPVVINVTSTTIGLMWGGDPEMNENGTMVEYQLRFRHQNADNDTWNYVTVSRSNLTSLNGLQEFATYIIQISPAMSVGFGPLFLEINTTTLQDGKVV